MNDLAFVTIKSRGGAHRVEQVARTTENQGLYHLRARLTLTEDEQKALYWERVATRPTEYPQEPQRPRRKLGGAALVKYVCKRVGCTPLQLAQLYDSMTEVLLSQQA